MNPALAYLRILGCGLLAFFVGALTVYQLGTSWWSRIVAIIFAVPLMMYARKREVRRGD